MNRVAALSSMSSYSLAGRTALVTGGHSGIGYAIADRFARDGIGTLILVARKREELDRAKRDLEGAYRGLTVATLSADLGTVEGVSAVVHDVLRDHPKLDVLVNNAGLWRLTGIPGQPTDEVARNMTQVLGVNYVGTVALARGLVPALTRSDAPVVVDVLSSAAIAYMVGNDAYRTSKQGLREFGVRLALETAIAGTPVRTTRIYPSNTDTPANAGRDVPKVPATTIADRVIGLLPHDAPTDWFVGMDAAGTLQEGSFAFPVDAWIERGHAGSGVPPHAKPAWPYAHFALVGEHLLPPLERSGIDH
jgi:uncharacterized oxidoreductase